MSTPASAWSSDSVIKGLTRNGQKELPSALLYDEVGSALFEAITALPEYGLTRADERTLRRLAPDLASWMCRPALVVELGSGSGRKTRPILEELARRHPVAYFAVDVSRAALQACEAELAGLPVKCIEATYLDGLDRALCEREPSQRALVLFLGSTIGNYGRAAAAGLLADIGRRLRAGDALLVGADLVKPVERLLLAYDDPAGVTAAFNRNILARLNREFGAGFDVRRYRHEARWDAVHRRIEMHLVADAPQAVSMAEAVVSIAAGESIRTEYCHKYTLEELAHLAPGFESVARWVDDEWGFAENLYSADGRDL